MRVKGEIWLARSDASARGRRSRQGRRSRRPRSPRRSHPSSLACVPLVRRRRDVTARYYLRHAARPYADANPKAPEAGQHARPRRFSARTASGARHLHGSGWRFRPRADAASESQQRRAAPSLFAQQCATCHSLSPADAPRQGPALAGIYGRKPGSVAGFHYSPGYGEADFVWDEAHLDYLLGRPPGAHSRRRHALQTEERRRAQSHHRFSEGAEVTGRPVPSMSRRGSADAAPQSSHHDQHQGRTP